LACIIVLNLIGLVMVLSASSVTALYDYGSPWHFFVRQVLWVAGGFAAMAFAMQFDYHRWRAFARPIVVATFVLLVAVLVMGVSTNGARRWIGGSSLHLQPSEFAKLALLLFTADLLARRADRMDRTEITLRPVVVVLGIFSALVMLQPNLGTTLLMAAIVLLMLFAAGTPLRSLGTIFAAAVAGAVILAIAAPYRRDRLLAFMNPWADPHNTGYQTIQSMVAIASGGWFGQGLGAGRAKWDFLPEAHTDFIFAILAEELGLIGALAVLALFVTLTVFGIRAAIRAPDRFGMLIAVGVTSWIAIQAVVNIGAVVGRLPITGVPLPFVSFGGSSMIVTMLAAGLLLNVARQAE
jgi:cell division protein FtsW